MSGLLVTACATLPATTPPSAGLASEDALPPDSALPAPAFAHPVYYYASEDPEKIATNPAETNAQRFVVVGIELELADGASGGEPFEPGEEEQISAALSPHDGRIRSEVIGVLQQATIRDLTRGRLAVIEAMRRVIQDRVIAPHVSLPDRDVYLKEVILTNMIIQ